MAYQFGQPALIPDDAERVEEAERIEVQLARGNPIRPNVKAIVFDHENRWVMGYQPFEIGTGQGVLREAFTQDNQLVLDPCRHRLVRSQKTLERLQTIDLPNQMHYAEVSRHRPNPNWKRLQYYIAARV